MISNSIPLKEDHSIIKEGDSIVLYGGYDSLILIKLNSNTVEQFP